MSKVLRSGFFTVLAAIAAVAMAVFTLIVIVTGVAITPFRILKNRGRKPSSSIYAWKHAGGAGLAR